MFILNANPDTIALLWSRTHAMFARACAAIGAASALAALSAISNTRRREIAGWLALVEAIVRKLIFAEAALIRTAERGREREAARRGPRVIHLEMRPIPWAQAFHRAAAMQAQRQSSIAAPVVHPEPVEPRAHGTLDLSQPHTWPARFRYLPPRDPLACPESRAPCIRDFSAPLPPPAPPPPPRNPRQCMPPPLKLAFRLEALRRAIANPTPYAQKLAKLFPRLSRRYPEAAQRYAIATGRPHFADREDSQLIVFAIALALYGVEILSDTS